MNSCMCMLKCYDVKYRYNMYAGSKFIGDGSLFLTVYCLGSQSLPLYRFSGTGKEIRTKDRPVKAGLLC